MNNKFSHLVEFNHLVEKKNYFVSLFQKEMKAGKTPETYQIAEIAANLEGKVADACVERGNIDSAIVNYISQSSIHSAAGDYGKAIQILNSTKIYATCEKTKKYIESEISRLSAKIT